MSAAQRAAIAVMAARCALHRWQSWRRENAALFAREAAATAAALPFRLRLALYWSFTEVLAAWRALPSVVAASHSRQRLADAGRRRSFRLWRRRSIAVAAFAFQELEGAGQLRRRRRAQQLEWSLRRWRIRAQRDGASRSLADRLLWRSTAVHMMRTLQAAAVLQRRRNAALDSAWAVARAIALRSWARAIAATRVVDALHERADALCTHLAWRRLRQAVACVAARARCFDDAEALHLARQQQRALRRAIAGVAWYAARRVSYRAAIRRAGFHHRRESRRNAFINWQRRLPPDRAGTRARTHAVPHGGVAGIGSAQVAHGGHGAQCVRGVTHAAFIPASATFDGQASLVAPADVAPRHTPHRPTSLPASSFMSRALGATPDTQLRTGTAQGTRAARGHLHGPLLEYGTELALVAAVRLWRRVAISRHGLSALRRRSGGDGRSRQQLALSHWRTLTAHSERTARSLELADYRQRRSSLKRTFTGMRDEARRRTRPRRIAAVFQRRRLLLALRQWRRRHFDNRRQHMLMHLALQRQRVRCRRALLRWAHAHVMGMQHARRSTLRTAAAQQLHARRAQRRGLRQWQRANAEAARLAVVAPPAWQLHQRQPQVSVQRSSVGGRENWREPRHIPQGTYPATVESVASPAGLAKMTHPACRGSAREDGTARQRVTSSMLCSQDREAVAKATACGMAASAEPPRAPSQWVARRRHSEAHFRRVWDGRRGCRRWRIAAVLCVYLHRRRAAALQVAHDFASAAGGRGVTLRTKRALGRWRSNAQPRTLSRVVAVHVAPRGAGSLWRLATAVRAWRRFLRYERSGELAHSHALASHVPAASSPLLAQSGRLVACARAWRTWRLAAVRRAVLYARAIDFRRSEPVRLNALATALRLLSLSAASRERSSPRWLAARAQVWSLRALTGWIAYAQACRRAASDYQTALAAHRKAAVGRWLAWTQLGTRIYLKGLLAKATSALCARSLRLWLHMCETATMQSRRMGDAIALRQRTAWRRLVVGADTRRMVQLASDHGHAISLHRALTRWRARARVAGRAFRRGVMETSKLANGFLLRRWHRRLRRRTHARSLLEDAIAVVCERTVRGRLRRTWSHAVAWCATEAWDAHNQLRALRRLMWLRLRCWRDRIRPADESSTGVHGQAPHRSSVAAHRRHWREAPPSPRSAREALAAYELSAAFQQLAANAETERVAASVATQRTVLMLRGGLRAWQQYRMRAHVTAHAWSQWRALAEGVAKDRCFRRWSVHAHSLEHLQSSVIVVQRHLRLRRWQAALRAWASGCAAADAAARVRSLAVAGGCARSAVRRWRVHAVIRRMQAEWHALAARHSLAVCAVRLAARKWHRTARARATTAALLSQRARLVQLSARIASGMRRWRARVTEIHVTRRPILARGLRNWRALFDHHASVAPARASQAAAADDLRRTLALRRAWRPWRRVHVWREGEVRAEVRARAHFFSASQARRLLMRGYATWRSNHEMAGWRLIASAAHAHALRQQRRGSIACRLWAYRAFDERRWCAVTQWAIERADAAALDAGIRRWRRRGALWRYGRNIVDDDASPHESLVRIFAVLGPWRLAHALRTWRARHYERRASSKFAEGADQRAATEVASLPPPPAAHRARDCILHTASELGRLRAQRSQHQVAGESTWAPAEPSIERRRSCTSRRTNSRRPHVGIEAWVATEVIATKARTPFVVLGDASNPSASAVRDQRSTRTRPSSASTLGGSARPGYGRIQPAW